jgi:1-aminocyclopropane-1-carboxylate deaminase/D-cysteine desulfhydrase-like pyridoxal-dependent ACC family enzyme
MDRYNNNPCPSSFLEIKGKHMFDLPKNRIKILDHPTLFQRLDRLSLELSHTSGIWMKRDDLMELGLGGNKVRSLEFWLGQALQDKNDIILAAGEPVSNLCRLSAAACCRYNMECLLIHNASEPVETDNSSGNSLLNRMMDVPRIWCGDIEDIERTAFTKKHAEKLKKQGKKPYIIGDPILGAMGYVVCAQEIFQQTREKNVDIKHLFISASSGPTEIGLVWGFCALNVDIHVHLITVEYKAKEFWPIADKIFQGLSDELGFIPKKSMHEMTTFYEEYMGEGHGKPTSSCILAAKKLASLEGIFVETTYNAKVLDGMIALLHNGSIPKHETVCYLNTGGIPALFSQNENF